MTTTDRPRFTPRGRDETFAASIVRERTTAATILTFGTVLFVAAIAIPLGAVPAVLSALTLPLPLVVLWLSSDVLRSDERGRR